MIYNNRFIITDITIPVDPHKYLNNNKNLLFSLKIVALLKQQTVSKVQRISIIK